MEKGQKRFLIVNATISVIFLTVGALFLVFARQNDREEPAGGMIVKNITTQGSLTATGFASSTFGNALIPNLDNTYDIGSPDGKNWRNAYFSGVLNASGTSFSGGSLSTSGTIAVGTSGTLNATSTIYHGLNIGTRTGFNEGGLNIDPSGNINTSGSIMTNGTNSILMLNNNPTNASGTFHVHSGGEVYSSGSIFASSLELARPSHSFTTDTDSGLYSAGNNKVGIVAGGTEMLRVDSLAGSSGGVALFVNPNSGINGNPDGFNRAMALGGTTNAAFVVGDGTNTFYLFADNSQGAGVPKVQIGTRNLTNVGFITNNTVRATLSSNFDFSIGSPSGVSSTLGNQHLVIAKSSTQASGTFYVGNDGSVAASGTIQSFGTAGSNANDYVCVNTVGLLSSKATACTGSSARELKDNIADLDVDINDVLSLRPRTYTRKSNGKEEVGLIADEVLPLVPSMATYDESGKLYGVEYSQLPMYLLKVIQLLEKRITELENNQNQCLVR